MNEELTLVSQENCGVCGKPLIYGTDEKQVTCCYCGKEYRSLICCPDGRYICDACHEAKAVEKAIARASQVPGGWFGSHGVCGSGIGVDIAVSVLTGATPLTGAPRALELATEFLKTRMGIELEIKHAIKCRYMSRNHECIYTRCRYFSNN